MTNINGICPVCDALVTLPTDAEVSEIISCPDCSTRLVITKLGNPSAVLAEAPNIEEDWGE